jgi:hypothetical protein
MVASERRTIDCTLVVRCNVEGSVDADRIAMALAHLLPLPQLSVAGSIVTPVKMAPAASWAYIDDDDTAPCVFVHADYNEDEVRTFYEVPEAVAERVYATNSDLTFAEALAALVPLGEQSDA